MEQKDNKRPSRPRFGRPSQPDKGNTFRKKPRFASDGDKEQKPEKAFKPRKKTPPPPKKRTPPPAPKAYDGTTRLNKYIANAGICSPEV